MADLYCDHGVYTSALGTTPTWGVPQEGDGTTKDAATASSVASIVLPGQPSAGNLLTICGLTLGATSGGTYNYTIGGSLSATVDNIVAAINGNASIGAATVASGVASGTPKVCNLMYARNVSGTTVELMMRIGSATLNHASNSNVGISASGWAPTITQFAGGSGGCWGWLLNVADIGVSNSITYGTYGVMFYKPYVGTLPTTADTVWARSGKLISFVATGAYQNHNFIHAAFSKNLIVDNGTIWTTDAPDLKVHFKFDAGLYYDTSISLRTSSGNNYCSYSALRRGGLEFEFKGGSTAISGGSYVRMAPSTSGAGTQDCGTTAFRNVKLTDSEPAATSACKFFLCSAFSTAASYILDNSDYAVVVPRPTITDPFIIAAYESSQIIQATGCTFNYNISTPAYPGDLVVQNVDVYYPSTAGVILRSCAFLGYSSGYKLLQAIPSQYSNATRRLTLIADNCSGLAMPGTYIGFQQVALKGQDPQIHAFTLSNMADPVAPGLRVETIQGVFEWVPDSAPPFPTLSATVIGSGLPWSARLIWVQAMQHSRARSYTTPPMRAVHQLSTGVKTLTLEMLVPTSLADGVIASFSYIDSGGTARVASTDQLTSSVASWANAGSYPSYSARKLSVITEYAVLANTEIACTVSLVKPAPDTVTALYVDPEFTVSA